MVYSVRLFVVCLTLCHFVLMFFSYFSIAITSLGDERANLSAFRMFDRFVLAKNTKYIIVWRNHRSWDNPLKNRQIAYVTLRGHVCTKRMILKSTDLLRKKGVGIKRSTSAQLY